MDPMDKGIVLNTEQFGAGPNLVILHGLFGSGTNWRTLARRFAEHYRVVVMDARNHGRSAHAASIDYALMCSDLVVTMDALEISSAHLIGHSMGGKTAMWTALEQPQRVQSLLVADIAPVNYARTLGPELAIMQALNLDTIERRADADALLAAELPEPALRAFLLQNLEIREGTARWRLNLEAIASARDSLVAFPHTDKTYSGPTLFLSGGTSTYLHSAHQAQIDALFPNVQMQSLPGAGHWLHAEQPEQFLSHALHHLRGV